jgi:isochorismate synthase
MVDLPIRVFWSLPGQSNFYTLEHGADDEANDHFVFAPFDQSAGVLELHGQAKQVDLADIKLVRPAAACTTPSTAQGDYLEQLRKTLKIITEGQLDKVVVSTVTQVQINIALNDVLQRLRTAHPNTFVYAFSHPQAGLWIGATPEPLVRSLDEPNRYMTVSLAGTRQREIDIVPWGQKESLEQSVVTDYIRAQLLTAGASELHITRPETIGYGNLEHLRSTLSFLAASIDGVIAHLHPTPAVAGIPLQAATAHIRASEKHDRAYYTGYLGLKRREQQVDLFVNLRCMQLFSDCALVYTGGGITFESDPEDEWRETRNKLAALVNTFAQ